MRYEQNFQENIFSLLRSRHYTHFRIAPHVAAVYSRPYKLSIIGASGIGKTALAQRMNKKSFSDQIQSTIGSNFTELETLHVWDFAGNETLMPGDLPALIRGSALALLCCDTTLEFPEYILGGMSKEDKLNCLLCITKSNSAPGLNRKM